MARNFNTDKNGNKWSNETIKAVWNKGRAIVGFSDSLWRSDKCSKTINFHEYGNRDSQYGWEIDHIIPASKGGEDNLENLQPLHWMSNASKGDNLNWNCF